MKQTARIICIGISLSALAACGQGSAPAPTPAPAAAPPAIAAPSNWVAAHPKVNTRGGLSNYMQGAWVGHPIDPHTKQPSTQLEVVWNIQQTALTATTAQGLAITGTIHFLDDRAIDFSLENTQAASEDARHYSARGEIKVEDINNMTLTAGAESIVFTRQSAQGAAAIEAVLKANTYGWHLKHPELDTEAGIAKFMQGGWVGHPLDPHTKNPVAENRVTWEFSGNDVVTKQQQLIIKGRIVYLANRNYSMMLENKFAKKDDAKHIVVQGTFEIENPDLLMLKLGGDAMILERLGPSTQG